MFLKFFLCISYQCFLGFFTMHSIYFFIFCFIVFCMFLCFISCFLFLCYTWCASEDKHCCIIFSFKFSFCKCWCAFAYVSYIFVTLHHCCITSFVHFLAFFLGASCWHFFSTFFLIMFLHDLIVQFLFLICVIYLILCMQGKMFLHCVFCFIFCYANIGVMFAFVSFIFAMLHHCWTTLVLHYNMYSSLVLTLSLWSLALHVHSFSLFPFIVWCCVLWWNTFVSNIILTFNFWYHVFVFLCFYFWCWLLM
jgi:hypothetical protein